MLDLIAEHLKAKVNGFLSHNKIELHPAAIRKNFRDMHLLNGVVIAAAGNGSRMGSLTEQTPKAMLDYQGKPLIDHTLDHCLEQWHDPRDVMVMIRDPQYSKYAHFEEMDAHIFVKGAKILYQGSDHKDNFLLAFLKEFYLGESSEAMRKYGQLTIIPADVVFEKPDVTSWSRSLGICDVSLLVSRQQDDYGRMWLKRGPGRKDSGCLKDFSICKPEDYSKAPPPGYEIATHTGGFIINTDLFYNPVKMAAVMAAFGLNRGSIAAQKRDVLGVNPFFPSIGYSYIDGNFKGFNTPEDLKN
jgi:hypothetical protein